MMFMKLSRGNEDPLVQSTTRTCSSNRKAASIAIAALFAALFHSGGFAMLTSADYALESRVFESSGSTASAALKRFEGNRLAQSAVAETISGKKSAEVSLNAVRAVMHRYGIFADRGEVATWFERLGLCGRTPSIRDEHPARILVLLQQAAAAKTPVMAKRM